MSAFSPYPEQYGGENPRVVAIYDALNTTRGNLYDTSDWSSTVAIENRAIAREIDNYWATNERAQNQFDPLRCTDMLPRWERVFAIVPAANDDLRRSNLAFAFAACGKDPTYQQLFDDLTALGGGCFVDIEFTTVADSQALYEGSGNTNPYDIDGATTTGVSWVDWSSAVGHYAVQLVQPAGMPNNLFADYANRILQYLDGALPAWTTFSIYEPLHAGALGFYLDEVNLDREALDA